MPVGWVITLLLWLNEILTLTSGLSIKILDPIQMPQMTLTDMAFIDAFDTTTQYLVSTCTNFSTGADRMPQIATIFE